MCTTLLPPGDNPIAINKYINIITFVLCTDILCLFVARTVFTFCSRLQRSINAFFETTQNSGESSLTVGGEGESVDTAK